jgi:hypothetical protein
MGKAATGALEHRAAFQNLRDALPLQLLTFGLRPAIDRELTPIYLDHGGGDAVLQVNEVLADLL